MSGSWRRRSLVARGRGRLLALRRLPDLERLRSAGVTIGRGASLQRGVSIDEEWGWLISLGEHCVLAPGVVVVAHDASMKRALGFTKLAPVSIGARAYIGTASIILPGVTVGDGAIVGAGSVVSRDVAPGTMAAGNPARALCAAEDFLNRRRAQIADGPVFDRTTAQRCADTWPEFRRQMEREIRAHGRGWVR